MRLGSRLIQGCMMAQIHQTTACPKCHKPKRLALSNGGGRKLICDCDGEDPIKSPDVAKLLAGALRPPE